MDTALYNSLYLEFRSKLLGPIFETQEFFKITSKLLPPLAKQANIGYVRCLYFAPASQFAPTGLSGEIEIYHDKERSKEVPTITDFSETMSTGEQGTFTFQAHPIDNHIFNDTERQIVQLLSWDFFILSGRARLMGNTRKMTITDAMTGAYNQAGIFAFTQMHIGNNLKDYSAIFINLKNFKLN